MKLIIQKTAKKKDVEQEKIYGSIPHIANLLKQTQIKYFLNDQQIFWKNSKLKKFYKKLYKINLQLHEKH